MENYLEDWVRNMPTMSANAPDARLKLGERLDAGFAAVREIVGKVWPFILGCIAIGAAIHGYVPQEFMASWHRLRQLQTHRRAYCHSGRRAGIAVSTLNGLGYKHVANYGGMEEARKKLQRK
ncbi:MAG TPA: hypothetical protein VLC92_00770 [Rhodocyclaceae bacterium]|nr:hypothetical protein [Rhodocyclaceae bacterium]